MSKGQDEFPAFAVRWSFERIWTALKVYTRNTAKAVGGVVLGAVIKNVRFKQACDQQAPFPGIMLSECQRPLVSRLPATGGNLSETL